MDFSYARGKTSKRKQALQTRWKEAIWVGVAKQSNEHIVVLVEEGQAIRCRTIKRKPLEVRWDGEAIRKIKATPRKPNPKDAADRSFRDDVRQQVERPEPVSRPEVREEEEVNRRNFRITRRILEKYGCTAGYPGCEAHLEGRDRGGRDHTRKCRDRIERKMLEDPEDKEAIDKRDKRLQRTVCEKDGMTDGGKEQVDTREGIDVPVPADEESEENGNMETDDEDDNVLYGQGEGERRHRG